MHETSTLSLEGEKRVASQDRHWSTFHWVDWEVPLTMIVLTVSIS